MFGTAIKHNDAKYGTLGPLEICYIVVSLKNISFWCADGLQCINVGEVTLFVSPKSLVIRPT